MRGTGFRRIMLGSRLAHYDISGHLGSGGIGDVYQAVDSKLGRSIALPMKIGCCTSSAARPEMMWSLAAISALVGDLRVDGPSSAPVLIMDAPS
jgi:hypothetical protein